jgi:hypothetical protein
MYRFYNDEERSMTTPNLKATIHSVCTDMYESYLQAAQAALPHADESITKRGQKDSELSAPSYNRCVADQRQV